MVELTKAEEQMMQYLWKLGEGTVQEVMASMEEDTKYLEVFMELVLL